jgi:hypothetical protein
MKKIVITIILMLNLIPILDREGITLWPAHTAYGQNQGEEEGDEECEEIFNEYIFEVDCWVYYHYALRTYNCNDEDEEISKEGFVDVLYEIEGCGGGTDPEDGPEDDDGWWEGCSDCGGDPDDEDGNEEEEDCYGDPGGSAYFDDCGCIGGNTGISECEEEEDENSYNPDPSQESLLVEVQNLFNTKTSDYFKTIAESMGLANGIQTLSHSAINSLITATGGQAVTQLAEIASKTGLGKIAAVGVVYNGLNTIVAFSDGNITTEDWYQLGDTLLNAASFIPGPVGIVATGVSVGIAVFSD